MIIVIVIRINIMTYSKNKKMEKLVPFSFFSYQRTEETVCCYIINISLSRAGYIDIINIFLTRASYIDIIVNIEPICYTVNIINIT